MTVVEAYRTLGLDGTRASADEVRARFRDLLFANHPDRAPLDRQARANEATRTLVEAYAYLRERGYPRVHERVAAVDAVPESSYEAQEAPEEAPDDPFAWVEGLWRESLRRGAPENAVTRAIARAAWWSLGALTLLALGVAFLVAAFLGAEWILIGMGIVVAVFGLRLAAAARSMISEVARYWSVWSRLADRAALARAKRNLGFRLVVVVLFLVGLGEAVRRVVLH
jgi:DnaJ domain